MDGPETMIPLSAVAGPAALILLWGPSKSHSVGGGLAPQRTLILTHNFLPTVLVHFKI